jgi:nicotinamidase/pyrazinamidase
MEPKSALIVVDVQNDFCPGGSLAVEEGDKVVPIINKVSSLFPLVVASQDWHPPGHISFASRHEGKRPFDTAEIHGESWVLWPDHCVQGSNGAELRSDLDTRPLKLIIRKGENPRLDSYSVFFENDKTTPTGLDAFLRGMETDTVYLCGLALDVCIYFSALDATRLGYCAVVIEDATRGIDSPTGSLAEAVADMKEKGVAFTGSESIEK